MSFNHQTILQMKRVTLSAIWTDFLKALLKERIKEPFTMSLVSDDIAIVKQAVNQGIDAYLEACFIPDRGDRFEYKGNRLECVISPESLPVLIRRLMNSGNENGELLASDICENFEIELI